MRNFNLFLTGLALALAIFGSALAASAGFTASPTVTPQPYGSVISFAVSASTDVEVAILDASAKIVRHLAAGVLGGQFAPPAPLSPGLSQTVVWDGLDDFGVTAGNGPFSVRVRLGLSFEYDRSISTAGFPGAAGNGCLNPGEEYINSTHPVITALAAGIHKPPRLDIAVDDNTEELYIKVGMSVLDEYRFNGATGVQIGVVSPVGSRERQDFGEIAFSWDGRVFYHSTGKDEIIRYTRLGQPAAWSGTGSNLIAGFPQGWQHSRGLSAGPDGSLYILHHADHRDWRSALVSRINPDGSVAGNPLITVPAPAGGGIRIDKQGNVYVGARVKFGMQVPEELNGRFNDDGTPSTLSWWAQEMYGSVIKYTPEGKSSWVYFGISPTPTHTSWPGGAACVCQVARFDIDRYNRLFLPDPFRLSVVIIDNNRNMIARVRNSDVPQAVMSWPHQVEVTDSAFYVADQYNNRVVRFRITSDTEAVASIPVSIEAGTGRAPTADLWMNNRPNPFHGGTRIFAKGPEGRMAGLKIVGLDGRVITDFGSFRIASAVPRSFVWDARNRPSGIYYCRLECGDAVKEIKLILVH